MGFGAGAKGKAGAHVNVTRLTGGSPWPSFPGRKFLYGFIRLHQSYIPSTVSVTDHVNLNSAVLTGAKGTEFINAPGAVISMCPWQREVYINAGLGLGCAQR